MKYILPFRRTPASTCTRVMTFCFELVLNALVLRSERAVGCLARLFLRWLLRKTFSNPNKKRNCDQSAADPRLRGSVRPYRVPHDPLRPPAAIQRSGLADVPAVSMEIPQMTRGFSARGFGKSGEKDAGKSHGKKGGGTGGTHNEEVAKSSGDVIFNGTKVSEVTVESSTAPAVSAEAQREKSAQDGGGVSLAQIDDLFLCYKDDYEDAILEEGMERFCNDLREFVTL
ncbi:hypothetical protein cypCar_00014592 [Cyprinus carpio]|nr:hypothetical protein cypCar_00014592 [Cyprinus carpio]